MATKYFVSILMLILIGGEFLFVSSTSQSFNITDDEGAIIDKPIYYVSIMMDDWFLCGGTIYSERVIITGAYCLHKFFHGVIPEKLEHIFVLAGNHDELLNRTKIAVESIAIHPDYDNDTLHDIAMLFLENDLEFNNYIGPIRLPESNETVSSNSTAVLTDMFFKKETGRKFAIIVQTEIREILDCNCTGKYLNNPELDTILCAYYWRKPNTLNGFVTSGSSLVVNNTLIGIAKYGVSCHRNCTLVTFTKVSKHVDWIINTAENWNASEFYEVPTYICILIPLIFVIGFLLSVGDFFRTRRSIILMKAQQAGWSLNDLPRSEISGLF